jgi:hypothetical protein
VICSIGFPHQPDPGRARLGEFQVETEYGMPAAHYGRTIEIDHVVSFELGGSNAIANLFPEPGSGRADYHVKDRLESGLGLARTLARCPAIPPVSAARRELAQVRLIAQVRLMLPGHRYAHDHALASGLWNRFSWSGHGEQAALLGQPFECVEAAVDEGDAASRDEVTDGGGDENLARSSEGGDAGAGDDGDACDLSIDALAFTGVESCADLDPEVANRLTDRARAENGAGGPVE